MKNKESSGHKLIIENLRGKSVLKMDVFQNTRDIFSQFKQKLEQIAVKLSEEMKLIDDRIVIEYHSRGEYEAQISFAGDVLIFHMHTNIFNFDRDHSMWKTSYVRDDESRSYCGMIFVYNFLADSFKYSRMNDSGYLIARIFINRDRHFFVEGKRQLGFLYNDFVNNKIDEQIIRSIIESSILYAIDFDLFTPPYDNMKEVSVSAIKELQDNMLIKTGKRLGFKFQVDSDQVE